MIVAGQDQAVAEWAGAMLGVQFQEPYTAFGFVKDGKLFGASIFNDYYPGGNCEWTYVGAKSFTPEKLRFLCRFVFEELKAARVTAKTRRGNIIVRRLLPKGGFVFEGVQKRYFGPDKADDALVYVMFRKEAERWLRRVVH